MQRKIHFSIILLFFPLLLFPQTYVNGSISTDTNWTSANSPFIVTGDITVLPNTTLTIAEGVVVKFDGLYELKIIGGNLIVNGSENNKVTFTSNQTQPNIGNWKKIIFDSGAQGQISYAIIEYANIGVHINETSQVISDCIIRNCQTGIYIEGTSAHPTIVRCTIIDNLTTGIVGDWASWGGNISVTDCTLDNNYVGINNTISYFNIQNCIIKNNTDYGILTSGGDVINNCMISNNRIGISTSYWPSKIITYCSINSNAIGIQLGSYPMNAKFNNNDIYNNTQYSVEYIGGVENGEVDGTNNWWGTIVTDDIDASIYDIYDNANLAGWINYTPFQTNSVLSISNTENKPDEFHLNQNYPNPFNPTTKITYSLDKDSDVSVTVYDISGKLIITLQNEHQKQGLHSITWNGLDDSGTNVGGGLYFYQVNVGGLVETKKMVYIK